MGIVYVKVRAIEMPAPYEYRESDVVLKKRDIVVVEANNGTTYGKVSCTMCNSIDQKKGKKLKKILRVATENDLQKIQKMQTIEEEAHEYCRELILAEKIDMKLVDVEATISGKKLIFYFTAEKRIDFREIVKNIATKYHARIEMVQIGVRDQARRVRGFGACGTELCCNTFIDNFEPVTIKMAKHQDLSLNPAKISGLCGRLMCCLAFEYDPDSKYDDEKEGQCDTTCKGHEYKKEHGEDCKGHEHKKEVLREDNSHKYEEDSEKLIYEVSEIENSEAMTEVVKNPNQRRNESKRSNHSRPPRPPRPPRPQHPPRQHEKPREEKQHEEKKFEEKRTEANLEKQNQEHKRRRSGNRKLAGHNKPDNQINPKIEKTGDVKKKEIVMSNMSNDSNTSNEIEGKKPRRRFRNRKKNKPDDKNS